tara:strand:+ start:563 stop:1423 length:861 start_codon:yes stop_codon:yes gene_type:complete
MSSSNSDNTNQNSLSLGSLVHILIFVFIFVGFYNLASGKVAGASRTTLIVVIFCFILYLFYSSKLFSTTTDLVSSITDADVHSTILSSSLKTYQNNYSITGWFYIDDWNYKYGEPKVLLFRPDTPGAKATFNPMIFFSPVENNLTVAVNCYSSDVAKPDESQRFLCNVKNINLQKWVHLGVVLNNRTLDVYLNGKLTKTCMLPGVPKINNGSNIELTPGNNPVNLDDNPGFMGYVSKIVFFPYDLTPQQVYDEYRRGFGGNLIFGNYDMKITFYKNGQETNQWNIF